MFYNVENLFDTRDDSATSDNDFTPAGALHWTNGRLNEKLNRISKVVIAAGEWQPPVIIGLCEIENRQVLNNLVLNTPLSRFNYEIIHFDSPDERGIDVALLYDSRKVRVAGSSVIPVSNGRLITRDILHVKSIIESDTCHIFVNHWPSRSSGQLETDSYRMRAAMILRNAVDSLFRINLTAKIIIMGDFNDDPGEESIVKGLMASSTSEICMPGKLCNLSVSPQKSPVKGTLKYQGNWNLFDQIIVSGGLLADPGIKVIKNSYRIFYTSFMVEADETYNGVRPNRTYLGYRYHGGFSDHLPVTIEIY